MATVSSDIRKIKLDKLRHAILSYKPGRAVPCDDKLVIGIIRVHPFGVNVSDMVPALRRALHGDEEPSISTEDDDQEEYLTDSISVINIKVLGVNIGVVRDLAGKVRPMVLLVHPSDNVLYPAWVRVIKKVTGRFPLCAISNIIGECEAIEENKNDLKELGITDIYDVPRKDGSLSVEERLQWLDLLHGCLYEDDD